MFESIVVLLVLFLLAKETGRTFPKSEGFWNGVALTTSVFALVVSVSGLVGYFI